MTQLLYFFLAVSLQATCVDAATANFLAVSLQHRCKDAATATFLTVSLTADFLAVSFVGHLEGRS